MTRVGEARNLKLWPICWGHRKVPQNDGKEFGGLAVDEIFGNHTHSGEHRGIAPSGLPRRVMFIESIDVGAVPLVSSGSHVQCACFRFDHPLFPYGQRTRGFGLLTMPAGRARLPRHSCHIVWDSNGPRWGDGVCSRS